MSRFIDLRAVVVVLLLGLLGIGLAVLVSGAGCSGGAIEIILPTPSPSAEVVVYVTGAVYREGVYTLREGDRVAEAVDAAGGLAPDADRARVNLAQRVADEQHVIVPRLGDPPAIADGGPVASPASGARVNVNTATQAELERLPGIGPSLAQAIIAYRGTKGRFQRVEDLLNVPRIGDVTLARLRPLVTV